MSETPTFLQLDLASEEFSVKSYEDIVPKIGGLGWALELFEKFAEEDPIVFSTGPLNSIFPGVSKTVCVFKSPQTGGLAVSLGGGSLARFLRFAGYQGLVILGKASVPTLVSADSKDVDFKSAQPLVGLEVPKVFERIFESEGAPSRRSVLVTGPGADLGFAFAPLYVDEFFSFARGGLGAAFSKKNLKGLVVSGSKSEKIENARKYEEVFNKTVKRLKGFKELSSDGTLRNLEVEKRIAAVPFKNLSETNFPGDSLLAPNFLDAVGGKRVSCAGCPVGCIHLLRADKQFVPYDYESVVSLGPLLGITKPEEVAELIRQAWNLGLDPTSLGAVLAHITEKEGLSFAELDTYSTIIDAFFLGKERWAKELRSGLPEGPQSLKLSGMEFLPYFNGYASILSQALMLGATTEDNRGYLLDLDLIGKDFEDAEVVSLLVDAERKKTLSELLVGCGYLAPVFEDPAFAFSAFEAIGSPVSHETLKSTAEEVFKKKLSLQANLGFSPAQVKFPDRFLEIPSPHGYLKKERLENMVNIYKDEIFETAGGF